MAVSDWMKPGFSQKSRVKILTVDPASRRVEGVMKDGSMIQIAVWEVPSLFRWPKEEEFWTVYRQNGYWMLDACVDDPANGVRLEDLGAGQARIAADSVVLTDGSILSTVKAVGSFAAYQSTAFAIANGSGVVLTSLTQDWDVSNWFDPVTGRFTPQVAGYYQFTASIYMQALGAGKSMHCYLRRDGTATKRIGPISRNDSAGAADVMTNGSCTLFLNGSTDYIDFLVAHSDVASRDINFAAETFVEGKFVGTAT